MISWNLTEGTALTDHLSNMWISDALGVQDGLGPGQ